MALKEIKFSAAAQHKFLEVFTAILKNQWKW